VIGTLEKGDTVEALEYRTFPGIRGDSPGIRRDWLPSEAHVGWVRHAKGWNLTRAKNYFNFFFFFIRSIFFRISFPFVVNVCAALFVSRKKKKFIFSAVSRRRHREQPHLSRPNGHETAEFIK
jgi:hypothetical protein